MKIEKLLLRRGLYQAPQGPVRAGAVRLKHWADTHAAMKAAGLRIPIGWGHQPRAVPADETEVESQQFWLSRLNAGYLDGLDYDPVAGDLKMRGDVPGCEVDASGNLMAWTELADGRKVKSAVGEVSAAIRDWTDGTGKLWKDAIIHVGITPLPVVAGQGGFRALSAADDGKTIYLSLTSLKLGPPMADDPKKKAPPFGGGADDDPDPAAAAAPDEPEVPEEPAPAVPDATVGPGSEAGQLSEALKCLKLYGLALPGDTTLENILERICVAAHAKHEGVDGEGEEEGEPGAPGDEEEGGATYGGPQAGAQPVEEQRPVMMSLTTPDLPHFMRKQIEREQERHKAAQLKRIDRLVKRGMPPYKAVKFREALSEYQLSLDGESGEPVAQKVDAELEVWDEALPRQKLTTLSGAREEPRPQGEPQSEEDLTKEQRQELDELANRVRRR
jgi:hypothetical protein